MIINYENISNAISFYKSKGYEQIEVPWITSVDNLYITCSDTDRINFVDGIEYGLVGSAEQGFLDLYNKLKLNKLYMAVSPCFRKWDESKYHVPEFMKLELFSKHDIDITAMLCSSYHINVAQEFLKGEQVETDEGCDLELNKIEIGSYGYRYFLDSSEKKHWWSYGTGIAEPRYSMAKAAK